MGGMTIGSGAVAHDSASANAAVVAALAPTGTLRASINLGNPVLAHMDAASHLPVGVSVDIATELARRLHVPLKLVVASSAKDSVANVSHGSADLGFFAVDPKRAETIRFTAPYVAIDGVYAVPADSPITDSAQVDRAGVKVAVGEGSAYDLFLSRELAHATVVRIAKSSAVVSTVIDKKLDVAAGVRQQIEQDIQRQGGMRMLDQRFMTIPQALGIPVARDAAGYAFLSSFVRDIHTSGFLASSIRKQGITGVEEL